MENRNAINVARKVFLEIFSSAPSLKFLEDNTQVEMGYFFDVQPNLRYPVYLSLQCDELHFSVERFWLIPICINY